MGLLVSGRNPAASKTAERSYFTATAGQTVFTIAGGYQVGDIDVFMNGVRLVESDDFTASNGSTVVLSSAASLGDHLAVVCYYQFQATGHWTKSESDGRYLTAAGTNPMAAYLKTPNYGITSASDSSSASMEANAIGGTQGVGVKAWGRNVATFGGDIHYITDSRGAGGAHRFYGWNGSSWTENAKIDSSGRLSVTNQPSIMLNGNSGSTTFTAGQYVTQMTAEHTSGGMVWDAGLGRVTVPVSGRYLISSNVYHYSTGSRRHAIMQNGTQLGLAHSSNSTVADESRSITFVRTLSAGDWIGLQIVYAGVYYIGYAHTHFSMHLLG